MNKLIKWPLIGLGVFIGFGFVGVAIDRNDSVDAKLNKNTTIQINGKPFELTEKEVNLMVNMMKEDLRNYAEGSKSLVGETLFKNNPITIISSATLQFDYNRNEVSADMKYKDKNLIVSGVVISIDRGIGENYSISLNGTNDSFLRPTASMAKGQKNYLASLSKGQKIKLYCEGKGMMLGSPVLDDCIQIDEFITFEAKKLTGDFVKKAPQGDKAALNLLLISKAIQPFLSENSACYSSDHNSEAFCASEISKFEKAKNKEIKDSIDSLKKQYNIAKADAV
jgi:putative nucleic acid binding protein